MIPQRLTVKYFIQDPAAVNLKEFVPIFHRWIQNQTVEGLLIDVADYKHIQDGPGIILVGDQVDYAIDIGDGRPGLLYRAKRRAQSRKPLRSLLEESMLLALRACRALELEPSLQGRIAFRTDEAAIGFPDRLRIPNNRNSAAELEADIQAVLESIYAGIEVKIQPASGDARQFFPVKVYAPGAPDVKQLLERFETSAAIL
jgi:hypothetical protein